MRITEMTTISELISMNQEFEKILENHNMNCNGCPGALSETLAEAAAAHGVNISTLIKDLNMANERE